MKMRATHILLACDEHNKSIRERVKSLYPSADEEMWAENTIDRDQTIFNNFKKMAKYAEQSEYPYLIIDQNEFNKLEKYL